MATMTFQSPDQRAEAAAYRPAGQRFPLVQFRASYDMASVDAFFATIASRSAFEIRAARFRRGFFSRGYSVPDVDRSIEWWARKKVVES
jgi:hypothetical protein